MGTELGGLKSGRAEATSPEYYDETALDAEMRRQFEVCHGCRMCLHDCPSFPALFDAIDDHDGDVSALSRDEIGRVVDLCYQCKVCFIKCPYTPPHEFMVDIPRLFLRARAVQARQRGVSIQDRFLGNTELVGTIGCRTAPISNWANRSRWPRALMEKLVGVHRERLLPEFHRQTFTDWFRGRQARPGTGRRKVALFYTCLVNFNDPEVGRASVEVLERSGVEVVCPPQRCCGMPFLDGGDTASALKNMEHNVRSLAELVRQGYDVVVPEPTCGMMLRKEYPDYLHTEDAGLVAQHTFDLCEYLIGLHRQGELDTNFKSGPGRIAYHQPCHLKYQAVGRKSVELLKLIPGTEVHVVDRGCSGMDGTWGMKRENFELSLKVASKLFRGLEDAEPDLVVTDCYLAGLQIRQGTGRKVMHPVQVVRDAYGPVSK